jgi:serine/threonine protein kinase
MIGNNIGKYKIIRLIGEGGMASVYEAEHEILGTKAAVKILNPMLSGNAQIRDRFRNEAKLMASLDHPNITKVIDFVDQPNQLSIVMEFLNGEDLQKKIKRSGAILPDEVKELFNQILSAFQYAHENGVVHRDIKPSNIFVLPDGRVKILDFGIAKLYGQGNEMTQTGTQIGTPIYMSPEQVKGDKSIDYRSDIYSLGVTMFYALNGNPPYNSETESQFDIFNKIVFDPLPELIGFSPYDVIIKKACQKDREQRFQSCSEFLDELYSNPQSTSKYKDSKTTTTTDLDNSKPENTSPSKPKNIKTGRKKQQWIIPVIALFILLVALFFALKEKDSDNDGVPDKEDVCKYDPGDNSQGCPDADGDGVFDYEDNCPDTPGDFDGCPDSDEDGISDYNDACPEEPGNNENGCFYYKQVTFENKSREKAWICIAYLHDNIWKVKGYYECKPGESYTYDLPEQFSSENVYWYASAADGTEWYGSDKYFSIDKYDAFAFENGRFTKGGDNPIRRGFYSLTLTEENTTQGFTD